MTNRKGRVTKARVSRRPSRMPADYDFGHRVRGNDTKRDAAGTVGSENLNVLSSAPCNEGPCHQRR